MRKLASIQTVHNITPIENADFIETVHVLGWTCIDRKGQHKIGDRVVYFEIDSFLPIKPQYEFLRESSYKNHPTLGEGFKIKTVKKRGQLSQGFVMPLPQEFNDLEVGTDVTEQLEVQLYEIPIPATLQGLIRGNFPSFIPKTDQERIQNIFIDDFYNAFKDVNFEITEKLDGSSMTIYRNNDDYGVCSRNYNLKFEQSNNTFVTVAHQCNIQETLQALQLNIAIQGELIGPGIQGNCYNLLNHKFYVFDIFNIDKHRYCNQQERFDIIQQLMNDDNKNILYSVPFIKNDVLKPTLQEMLLLAEGKSCLNPKIEREGIVLKSIYHELDKKWSRCDFYRNGIISFKVISNRFLLKQKDSV